MRTTAIETVKELVAKFHTNASTYTSHGSAYNETQARSDFITPFLEALGWDVRNSRTYPEDQRDVIEEATIEVGEERINKKPDYELRVARQRKMFVEAKRPSKRIKTDKDSAFQVRRYGFSASMPISVLTNFEHLIIYDCMPGPNENDDASTCRLKIFHYREYERRFDEIYDLLSREFVHSGQFDKQFKVRPTYRGTNQFDDLFLKQIRAWRTRLAEDIVARNQAIDNDLLTYSTQRFLTKLIFLRICEDRDIEKYESLKKLAGPGAYKSLKGYLAAADKIYNSGLFKEDGDPSLELDVSDTALGEIITDLYYPKSAYTFAVIEPEILGEVYEMLLGEVLEIRPGKKVETVLKPEVKASGGVCATPQFVVESIIDKTVRKVTNGKGPSALKDYTVADIACGSGIFLLAAYQAILDCYREWYIKEGVTEHAGSRLYDAGNGRWELTLQERRDILLRHIYGVDIDYQAVEVARFSLLLKLIEKESADSIKADFKRNNSAVLPILEQNIQHGNSLVSKGALKAAHPSHATVLVPKIVPFDWNHSFPMIMGRGGFSALIGNPPYIRIQNMVAYSPEEVEVYRHPSAGYFTTKADNFDKYALFTERAMSLLKRDGLLGFIIPNKFFTIKFGRNLRQMLANGHHVAELVHFGAQQVFGTKASNYTCILIATNSQSENVKLERVTDLRTWRYGQPGEKRIINGAELTEEPWPFASDEVNEVFDRIRQLNPKCLDTVADIFVGAQTSADKVYIIAPTKLTKNLVTFKDMNGDIWEIETGLLRPFLHDVQIVPFKTPTPNKYIIWPYTEINGEMSILAERELKSNYPLTWDYLAHFKTALGKRSILGGKPEDRKWYQFGRAQSLNEFNAPKIIAQVLALEPRYTYDEQNIVVTGGGNGPYYLIRPLPGVPYSPLYLLAVLCHPISEAIIRTKTTVFRGGYYSHGKQFLAKLPIPAINFDDPQSRAKHDSIVQQVIDLIALTNSIVNATTPLKLHAVNTQIEMSRADLEQNLNALLSVTKKDFDTIRSVPIPE